MLLGRQVKRTLEKRDQTPFALALRQTWMPPGASGNHVTQGLVLLWSRGRWLLGEHVVCSGPGIIPGERVVLDMNPYNASRYFETGLGFRMLPGEESRVGKDPGMKLTLRIKRGPMSLHLMDPHPSSVSSSSPFPRLGRHSVVARNLT